jgi:hypothetical protein
VADLIENECGVANQPGHVWRRLGWSCQRPTGRASHCAVEAQTLTRNQKRAQKRGFVIFVAELEEIPWYPKKSLQVVNNLWHR